MATRQTPSDAEVRHLLERLFLRSFDMPAENRLFVGELPPEWDIPLPAQTTVVGAHQRREFHTEVVLDLPGTPEQAAAEIERTLAAHGWRATDSTRDAGGGFTSPHVRKRQAARVLCDDRRRWHVYVGVVEGAGGIADVRISLDADPTSYHPCEAEAHGHRSVLSVFPALVPPPGMTYRSGGGGGGGASANSHATLTGELSVNAIEEHFRDQLVEAGWSIIDRNSTGRLAWSAWDFTGEAAIQWTGLLTVTQPSGQANVRELVLIGSAALGPEGSSGSLHAYSG